MIAEADRGDFFERVVLMRQALARVAIRRGDWVEATRELATADSAARSRGFEDMRGPIAYDRGRLALSQGDARGAARLFEVFSRNGPDGPAHPVHRPDPARAGLGGGGRARARRA